MKNQSIKRFRLGISLVMSCLISVFVFAGAFPGKVSAEPIQPRFPEVSGMQKISDGVFVSTGDYVKVKMGLIVSGNVAALIDTGAPDNLYDGYDIPPYVPYEALRVKQYIEENNLELKYILLTHNHIDHNGNLSMFKNDDTIVYDPSNTKNGQLITLGDKTFKVVRTVGHLNDEHISIELVKENILFAGDVVVTSLPTAVAFGGNFKGLIPTLEMLRTKNYSVIVPGHGDIINPHEVLRMNLEYLKNVEKYVTRIIDNGGTLEDALKISLSDCMKETKYLDPVDSQTAHEWNLETAYYEFLK
jgi:glyoxylase-like metal-dependent hydrolase (beta-lactamase superfamily II)